VANYPNYIKKTLLGKDASDTYPIYKYELIPEALPTSVLAKTLPKIILTSGVHGEEKPATDALYHMVYSLCNEWKTNPLLEYLRFNVEIVFIPVINPWGFTNNTRHNSNNVDINRNYSELWTLGVVGTQVYGGTAPWSEIESQYVKSILDNNTDAVFYSDLHSAGDGSDYSKLLYHVVPLQNYYKENTEILAVYNIEQMTRQYIKNYNLPDNIGYFGRLDHSIIGGIAPLYGISLGIPSTSSECFYKLPGEPNLYSSNTIKACSEWLVNWVLTIIKLAKQTIS
jgi:predicted deacylase